MDGPLITVVIPVYNREKTILRAVNSVLQQSYRNIEVIVVDDCSTDATVSILKNCEDDRLYLICLPRNQGANYARNRGIEKAKGEYIAFQDSDDEWLDDKLSRQISYMLEERVEASFSPYFLYQGGQVSVIPQDYQSESIRADGIVQRLKAGNIVGTPTLIVKKDVFSQVGMFSEKMKRLQDYEFVIRLVKKFKLGYMDQPLVKAYRLERSISTNNSALIDACINLMEEHSDFVDLAYIVDILWESHVFFRGGHMDWTVLEKIIDAAKKLEAGEECYRRIVEHLYKEYFLMKEMLERWYTFFNRRIKTGGYAIYGAGVYGHKVFEDMKNKNCLPKYFLVTSLAGERQIEGIPVLPLKEHDGCMPIIIAVSWEIQSELIKNLLDRNIHNFCVYPFLDC